MICCRCGYQRRTDKHFTDELVSYATPSRVAVRLEVLQVNKTLKYTGIDAESKIRKHDFGNFIEKQRPLGNYHGMGNFYLLASRVIVYNVFPCFPSAYCSIQSQARRRNVATGH